MAYAYRHQQKSVIGHLESSSVIKGSCHFPSPPVLHSKFLELVMTTERAQQPTQIIRPRAVKAGAASFHVPDKFREECREGGIPTSAVVHAVEHSAEWHRRWVLQEEEGHTMPHDEDQWARIVDELRIGAQNPALSDSSQEGTPEPQVTILRPIALRPQEVFSSHAEPPRMHDRSESPNSPLTVPSGTYGPVVIDELFDDVSFECFDVSAPIPTFIHQQPRPSVEAAKETLLHALAISGGDVETKAFTDALKPLVQHYGETGWDACDPEGLYSDYDDIRKVEGMWLTLSKATYFGNLGETADGDPMYTLGRMAFDMFLPTQLVCSLQGNFNPVAVVCPEERAALLERCPKSLRDEIGSGNSILRKYE